MCRGVETFRERSGRGGLWALRLTGDVGYKSFLDFVFGFYPVNIGEALKHFEQGSNAPIYIFGRIRVERPIKELATVVQERDEECLD